ncbi:hypothetical protein [Streptomyces sp. NPDC051567]
MSTFDIRRIGVRIGVEVEEAAFFHGLPDGVPARTGTAVTRPAGQEV